MSVEEQQNSPLHGLSAETMMTELVEFYGWEILYAAMGLKCFKMNPTIPSCLTFLQKTEWARHKIENFYLYRFKGMPKARDEKPNLKAEFNDEPHVRGVCSMARSGHPDSANSQFFICFDDASFLDKQYTAWGRVLEGMENVDKFARGEPVPSPDKIVSMKVAADA